jgi:hypothetical protein
LGPDSSSHGLHRPGGGADSLATIDDSSLSSSTAWSQQIGTDHARVWGYQRSNGNNDYGYSLSQTGTSNFSSSKGSQDLWTNAYMVDGIPQTVTGADNFGALGQGGSSWALTDQWNTVGAGTDSFTGLGASWATASSLETVPSGSGVQTQIKALTAQSQLYAQGQHTVAPDGGTSIDSLASFNETGTCLQTTADSGTLTQASTWSLTGSGSSGSFFSQTLGTFTQGSSVETYINTTSRGNQGFGVPATSFIDGQQQVWAPLGLPYSMSTANVPDLSGGTAIPDLGVPLTVQEPIIGRPGFPTLAIAALASFNGPANGWRLYVAAQPQSSLGVLWIVPDAGLPWEAGTLTTHGGVSQDEPGGGWAVWAWQPKMLSASWTWVRTSEMLVFTFFVTLTPTNLQTTASQEWDSILDSLPEDAQVSKDWWHRMIRWVQEAPDVPWQSLWDALQGLQVKLYLTPQDLGEDLDKGLDKLANSLVGLVPDASAQARREASFDSVPIDRRVMQSDWRGSDGQITIGSARTATFDPNFDDNRRIAANQIYVLGMVDLMAWQVVPGLASPSAAALRGEAALARQEASMGALRSAAADEAISARGATASWRAEGALPAGRAAAMEAHWAESADMCGFARACFTGEMLLDWEQGKKRADQIQVGDKVWSRSEFDPHGPIELKEVEEVFVRTSPVWNVHVAGQVIRTTPEHPFWVLRRGWIPARMLDIGDLLGTRNGLLVPVEGLADSGAVETVYNWRIADYHTYFVSAANTEISIWTHNAECLVGTETRPTGMRRSRDGAVIPRRGRRGVDADHHNANVQVRDATGSLIVHERLVSGSMTPEEKALRFPRSTLASHTEARAVRNISLQPEDVMIITGHEPPCPPCRGAMNRAARETGARIIYRWRQDGVTRYWEAGL